LEGILKERYAGKLWEDETRTVDEDPRFARTDENLEELNKLKADIESCIAEIRKEFAAASMPSKPL
jgi:hypothetical protein